MKHLKTLQELNESSENLNISDVSRSFTIEDLKNAWESSLKAQEEYMEPIIQGSYPVDHKMKSFEDWFSENYD
jgi:hypothetical protein